MGRIVKKTNTKNKILKQGLSLLQRHGYNGFSFLDIAKSVDIKKASVYDHYSSKEELILAILLDYESAFKNWTNQVKDLSVDGKINSIFKVFYMFSCDNNKVCPVMALMIDTSTLTLKIRNSMQEFVNLWLAWLSKEIKKGQKNSIIRSDLSAKELSEFVYNQMMGAQLQARLQKDPEIMLETASKILKLISV